MLWLAVAIVLFVFLCAIPKLRLVYSFRGAGPELIWGLGIVWTRGAFKPFPSISSEGLEPKVW